MGRGCSPHDGFTKESKRFSQRGIGDHPRHDAPECDVFFGFCDRKIEVGSER
jgi:hypothetical protein